METSPSIDEIVAAIKSIKNDKTAGVDETGPEMLKALKEVGAVALSVIKGAWESGSIPEDWQTGMIVPILKKESRSDYFNFRGITLLSIPGRIYSKVLKMRCRSILEDKLEEIQCGFRPGKSTANQLLTLKLFSKNFESKPISFSLFHRLGESVRSGS